MNETICKISDETYMTLWYQLWRLVVLADIMLFIPFGLGEIVERWAY